MTSFSFVENFFNMHFYNFRYRVGRGGRYGRHGMAITFVTEKEVEQIHEIEKFYGTSIEPLPDLSTLRIE